MPQGVRCPLWEAGLALFGVGLFSLGVFCYDREEVLTFRVNENWPKSSESWRGLAQKGRLGETGFLQVSPGMSLMFNGELPKERHAHLFDPFHSLVE